MDISSYLNEIKNNLITNKNKIQILTNSLFGTTIVLKGITGNETTYSTGSANDVLQQDIDYDLSSYPTNKYRQYQILGNWSFRSSDSNSTSYLRVDTKITTNQNPINLSEYFSTQSTRYVNRYYDSGEQYKIITGNLPHLVFTNLNLKWYLTWIEGYSGGEGESGSDISLPPPGGGEYPPPPPRGVPSTAYAKYNWLILRLF